MVRVEVAALLLSCAVLAGCAEPLPDAWVYAARTDNIFVAYTDREADQCFRFVLAPRSPIDSPSDNSELEIRGGDYVLRAGWPGPYTDDCTIDHVNGIDDHVSGTIALHECSLDFDLRVTIDPTMYGGEGPIVVHEVAARDVPIADPDCPYPLRHIGDYPELDAAWGLHDGVGNLVIAAYDAERESCVWARFIDDSPAPIDSSEVEAPEAWLYAGVRFARIEPDACVASSFVVPPGSSAHTSDSAPPLHSTGTLSFVARSSDGAPCSLDVDLALRSYGRYDWTPDEARLHATEVPVTGMTSCP